MNNQNKDLYKELQTIKKNRNLMTQDEYLRQMRAVILKIKELIACDLDVKFEEVKVLESANKIINNI